MLNKNIKSALLATCLSIAAALSLASQSFAQADSPELIRVNLVTVNSASRADFLMLHREVYPKNREYKLITRQVFGDTQSIAVITPLSSYGTLDQNTNSMSAGEFAIAQKVREAIVARRSFVIQRRPELSQEQVPRADLSRRIRFEIDASRTAEFEAFWADTILPAFARSNISGYQLFQTVMGGPQGEYWGTMPLASFSELDGFNITGGLSERDQTEVGARFNEFVIRSETVVTQLDRENSYGI
jgi:hypothetical protein